MAPLKKQLLRILPLTVAMCFWSCNRLSSEDRMLIQRKEEIVATAQERTPVFKAFADKFDKTKSFISYITGKQGKPTWTSKAPLFERYVVDMRVAVSIDRKTLEVTPKGSVEIEIREIIQISQLPDGRAQILYGETRRLNPSQVTRLLEDGATLEQLGIALDARNPTPGFNDYLAY